MYVRCLQIILQALFYETLVYEKQMYKITEYSEKDTS